MSKEGYAFHGGNDGTTPKKKSGKEINRGKLDNEVVPGKRASDKMWVRMNVRRGGH